MQGLANSKTFQRFAVRSSKIVEELQSKGVVLLELLCHDVALEQLANSASRREFHVQRTCTFRTCMVQIFFAR